jgi:hypothetical protein
MGAGFLGFRCPSLPASEGSTLVRAFGHLTRQRRGRGVRCIVPPVPALTDPVVSSSRAALSDSRQLSLLLMLACFALGQAVQVSNGGYSPTALGWLAVALATTLLAVGAPVRRALESRAETLALVLAYVCMAWQLYQLSQKAPGIYLRLSSVEDATPFFAALWLAGLAMLLGLGRKPVFRYVQLALLLAVFAFLGRWMLHFSAQPKIDVFYFQRDAVTELMAGRNPYAMQYQDIYGASPFYGEDISVGGKLTFGFPYMPLSLLLVLPAQLALGDYRWALLFAMALTAFFLATAVPTRLSFALAGLYLFTPRSFFVLEQGWTEPLALMLLAATLWTAIRFPRALPVVLGLCLAVKQTMVLVLPAVWLLLPRPLPARRELLRLFAITLAVGAASTLPFFLWDPGRFWRSVVVLQFLQPFRLDALSYLVWFAQTSGIRLPSVIGFIVAVLGLVLGIWRRSPTPAGFAATATLAFLLFFAFNKQAFCNYYYMTLGSMALAAAVSRPASSPAKVADPPRRQRRKAR